MDAEVVLVERGRVSWLRVQNHKFDRHVRDATARAGLCHQAGAIRLQIVQTTTLVRVTPNRSRAYSSGRPLIE